MSDPRFLRTVCFRSVSDGPGDCRRCAVARLPLAQPDVRVELRRHAEERLLRKRTLEQTIVWLIAGLLAAPLLFILPLGYVLGVLLGVGIGLSWLHPRVQRGSAGATLAARLIRMSRELGRDTNVSSAPLLTDAGLAANAGADPATMSPPELIAWLGITADR